VLLNPQVDAAVLETARGGILRAGLAFDQCDVAVVTNIGDGDHLGLSDINTPEQLAKVKRTIVDVVAPQGTAVLNAADPLVAGMASYCPGHVLFFAIDGNNPVIVRHRGVGGRAIFVRGNDIVLADGDRESVLMGVDRVPLTFGGRISFEVENTLAVLAAATCLGVPAEVIRTRAENFAADMDKVPGRFNLLEIRGATVIVDYGHNCHSLNAMIAALEIFPQPHRTCVYSTAGDRRDCDIIRQGEMLGEHFDRVILYEDHYMRGRAEGEIMGLLRQGLAAGKRVRQIEEVRGAVKSVETALQSAQPGDLLLIQADTIDETVDFMRRYLQALAAETAEEEAVAEPAEEKAAVRSERKAEPAGPVLAKAPVPAKAEAVV
jgi:cyanophycin synthetase